MFAVTALAALKIANLKDEVLHTFKEDVEYLAWTHRKTIVAVTKDAVMELPTNRSRPLRRFGGTIDDPFRRPACRLLLNANRTRAIGNGFVLDLKTLSTTPLAHAAVWVGNRLIEIDSPAHGKYRTYRKNDHPLDLAPGWFLLGISENLRLALATRNEPSDLDRTYLLRLDPRTGQSSIVTSYKGSSTDHEWLSWVQQNGRTGKTILHAQLLAADFTTPYLAKTRLWPLEFRVRETKSGHEPVQQTSASVEWIDPSSPWTLVQQTSMLDGRHGFDASALELWNSNSGDEVDLAGVTAYWTAGRQPRGSGPTLGAYALDWRAHQIAYVIASGNRNRVILHRFTPVSSTR